MRVIKAKSSLLFVLGDILDANKMVVNAQRVLPYPVSKNDEVVSAELVKHAEHYDTDYTLLDSMRAIRKKKEE